MNKKIKIYVGCGLTGAPEDFKLMVDRLKGELRKLGYEVFDFLGLVNGTAKDVYRVDIEENVNSCDIFIGICDYPSIGLGYETAIATEMRKIPVLCLANVNSNVTRLIQGVPHRNYSYLLYKDFDDMVNIAGEFVKNNS